jgi:hypothetical protein
MTGLQESVFPYVIECPGCPYDSTVEITYDEAVDALPFGLSPSDVTPRKAVNNALVSKGWWEGRAGRVCPKCMEDRE